MSDPRRSNKNKANDKTRPNTSVSEGTQLFLGSKVIDELRILLRLASPHSRRLGAYPGHFQPAADL